MSSRVAKGSETRNREDNLFLNSRLERARELTETGAVGEDADDGSEPEDADAGREAAEEEGLTAAVLDALADVDVLSARLPIVLSVVQSEDDGTGCASGVTGCPWKNVDVPYTPIGC